MPPIEPLVIQAPKGDDPPTATLYYGADCRESLRRLPAGSVHTVCTSPPYWGLRNYENEPSVWGGDKDCDHEWGEDTNRESRGQHCTKCNAWLGQLGLEPSPYEFVAHLVEIFAEVKRVLRDDGTLWLNLGDSYANPGIQSSALSSTGGFTGDRIKAGKKGTMNSVLRAIPEGIKYKDLVGIPWMVAFALRANGWYLRADIIWAKANPMPESVTDRPTKAHEYLFLMTKNEKYFYDADAIKEEGAGTSWNSAKGFSASGVRGENRESLQMPHHTGTTGNHGAGHHADDVKTGRNKRSVWNVNTKPYRGAHFACVDDVTEALTPKGWARQNTLQDGDLIASFDQTTSTLKWQPATFHRYDYDANMVVIDKRDTSQWLTPNHRCLVRYRSGRVDVVEADHLTSGMEVPTAADFPLTPTMSIGLGMASLLGWYVAEGENHHPGYVYLYQSNTINPDNVVEIRNLLTSLGANFKEVTRQRTSGFRKGRLRDEVTWSISGDVARKLQEIVPNKKLTPQLALALPMEEASALMDSLIKGDGHQRIGDGRRSFIQKDLSCAEAVQILGIRLGFRAHLSCRKPDGMYVVYLTDGMWLKLRGAHGLMGLLSEQPYKGVVWCPSVPTGLWLARRDGKPFITGNTWPEDLVEPMILAGTGEKGCCAKCGAAYKRVVEKEEPDKPYEYKAVGIPGEGVNRGQRTGAMGTGLPVKSVSWEPGCECPTFGLNMNRPQARRAVEIFIAKNLTQDHIDAMRSVGFGAEDSKKSQLQTGTGKNTADVQKLADEAKAVLGSYYREFLSANRQDDLGPPCDCEEAPLKRCVVLDPFSGSATTGKVANDHGRDYIGLDANTEYLDMAVARLQGRAAPQAPSKEASESSVLDLFG